MRQDVAFTSQGLRCAGWLYTPDDRRPGERRPAIVMAHGFSAVKEMHLASFAERFCAAGFVTLVFDYRYFGDSEGGPRSQLFPHEQHEDYRSAITWVSLRDDVDPTRIGVWGSSYSGA
jgi:dipeptidyl aminopeptidase/acylaminoacyl peptidase